MWGIFTLYYNKEIDGRVPRIAVHAAFLGTFSFYSFAQTGRCDCNAIRWRICVNRPF